MKLSVKSIVIHNGKFYNPLAAVKKLDKNKIYLIHAKDDKVVYIDSSIKFAKLLGCKITVLKKADIYQLR